MLLPNDVKELIELFEASGFKLYVIGGAVRDYLLKREIYDYDFTTDATPCEMIEILKNYKIDDHQSKLGSIKVHLNNKIYEITTFRTEEGIVSYRYPEHIKFVKDLKNDVIRRDFTINSLAYSLKEGLVDYLNGLADLENNLIRFNKDTFTSINEDPIRIIRALRFSCLLKFNISSNDLKIFKDNAYKVDYLSVIKYEELVKLFKIDDAKVFILNHLDIYKKAYPFMNDERFINVLNSDLDNKYLKLVLENFVKTNLNFTKYEKLILNGLKEIKLEELDLYKTKLLMIKYQDVLEVIIDILKSLGNDVESLRKNILTISSFNHPLYIKDLKVTYLDLEQLNIEKCNYSKILKHLLNVVLVDESLNTKENLIEIIKKVQ